MALEKRETPVIASLAIEAHFADGTTTPVTIGIGTPYRCTTGEWACPVKLTGLYESLADARGGDSLQALCLALSLAFDLLQDVRDRGGRLSFEGGSEFPLEAYAFGVARKA
ncbi:hypothetical protein [Phenylobacterium sp.]|uniref:DUF6968 family protein n=1 Tax=Phenylobacterium sp. TaxID=1871053 RepID=UPI0025F347CA|nr:hypothetical protein [Phenylobacterium sp.]MBX3485152.1 hypothetical protein [Phenylobacterium sp.]MCW5759866.1 hypothetical protein [Phenylobacterium sp.]